MEIKENYPLVEENGLLLVSDENLQFYVIYNVIREVSNGLGYIDYDTAPDHDETNLEIEIIECFICDDDLKNVSSNISDINLKVINEYLKKINEY
tara:strand:- start:2951 stop:3235 length:285 start_codon:yes stop_codon:yes gene_type:complete